MKYNFILLLLLLLLLLFSANSLFSQSNGFERKALAKLDQWHDGTIVFADKTFAHGSLVYNELNGSLTFKSGESTEPFGPNTVSSFEITDSGTSEKRTFVSIPYPKDEKDPARGTVNAFVELLCETKTFALFSKISPIKLKQKSRVSSYANGMVVTDTWNEYQQKETLVFMDSDGNLRPYLELVHIEADHFFWESNSSKKKQVDADLLEELTGRYYPKLMDYAKANKLKKNKKEDVVQLINYYMSISGS